ncbi:MAG: sugar phosphate isomerase/epimerase [Bryobacterales bacterium]|nr:sugar phosphate isomerase/epimerase [Bryobacterales bacterium]
MTRRTFFTTSVAGVAMAMPSSGLPPLCIFSKHLANLNYDQLGKTSKDFGFDGVDLAVRPGGHVLPEKVTEDLPRAYEAIRAHGVSVPMITTGLLRPEDPAARPTLATAGRLKITKFKSGYWKYGAADPEKKIAEVKAATRGLVDIGKEHGVELGFHNHSGDYVGTAIWDTREILAGLDPKWAGFYFDPAHATVEGGLFGWQVSIRLAAPRMKMVAIKDFYWEKTSGKWKLKWCPLGEGMVNWAGVFKAFAEAKYTGPLSLHVEYETKDEHAAIAKDLEFLRAQVKKAYGA